jgi:hypothetical protein
MYTPHLPRLVRLSVRRVRVRVCVRVRVRVVRTWTHETCALLSQLGGTTAVSEAELEQLFYFYRELALSETLAPARAALLLPPAADQPVLQPLNPPLSPRYQVPCRVCRVSRVCDCQHTSCLQMYADLQQRAYSIFVDESGRATHLSFISAVSALARGSPQEKLPRTPSPPLPRL